jgi:hypothetical protein
LAAHERGEHETSLAGFERALERSPGYAVARFNAACAHSRLGRVDRARDEVRALLCADLPTFAPRVLADPDLEALRASADLAGFVDSLRARYEAAMREGVPLVAYREEPFDMAYGGPTTAQAGVWIHAERRFVPLGPSIRAGRGDAPIVAPLLDPERGRVVVVTTPGSAAEGPAAVPTRLRLYRAATGEALADARLPAEVIVTELGFVDDGVAIRTTGWRGAAVAARTFLLDDAGLRRAPAAEPQDYLRVGPLGWWHHQATSGFPLAAGARGPTTPSGLQIFARGARRQRAHHSAWVDRARDVAAVLAADWGDCGHPDRYTVDVVDLGTGRSVRQSNGRGQVHVMLGHDGALYLQRGDTLERFGDPRLPASETLPSGLGISSRPNDANPYC